MRIIHLTTITVLFALVHVGCSFRYQPVGFRGGYSETSLDENFISVRYQAPSILYEHPAEFTKEQHMQFFLLYRCAEVTSLSGHDYFVVIDSTIPIIVARSGVELREYRVIPVVSAGSILGAAGRGLPRSRTNNVIDTNIQEATIQMFDGEKLDSKSFTYNAKELLKTLPLQNLGLAAALKNREN